MESFAAMKQVDPCSAADARASKILRGTTYHDECRYQVGMSWADDESSLPNNYFSALVQFKSLERLLQKCLELVVLELTTRVSGNYRTTQCFTLTSQERYVVYSMVQRNFMVFH